MMITRLRFACIGLLFGGWVLFSVGCAGVVYPAGTVGYYDYDYYPDLDVYFYPEGGVYYWNEGGHWSSGRRLPPTYHFHEESHEQLRLHSRQPWTEHHEEHVQPEHSQPDHDRH
ncbi:MAG: hypothetical protein ACREFE_20295 [Limisphaerales bacterium]